MRQLEQQRTVSGNSPETLTYPEAAGQTFEVGAPLSLNASGQVLESASPATSVVGVAAVNASGKTGNPTPFWVANDDTLFGVALANAVQADVGTVINILKTGAIWGADRTAGGCFLVQEVGRSLPPGQTIARGKFLESKTVLAKTA
jgi:hypothetical protein